MEPHDRIWNDSGETVAGGQETGAEALNAQIDVHDLNPRSASIQSDPEPTWAGAD